jgi:hypothetical protein
MVKNLSKICFYILFILDRIFFFLTKRSFLEWFPEFWYTNSYKKIKISNTNVKFFIPNNLVRWRVETLNSKEPDTIEWIKNFKQDQKIIFWDIGANIGLFSIYNAITNKNSENFAFEPSTSNLRILSRNISINKLYKKIKIFTNPLSDQENIFLNMKEEKFHEGSAFNNFDKKVNKNKENNSYQILGTNIKYLITNKILDYPDYIKIDVDGNEDLILKGAGKLLKNKKIKSVLCEIDERDVKKKNIIKNIFKENNFVFKNKRTVQNISNFIFIKI